MRMSQSLLPDMELPKNMLPTILDMKNSNRVCVCVCVCLFFKSCPKDRMTHFSISVTVKHRRENKATILKQ